MKKLIYIFCLIVAGWGITSCEDYLDTPSQSSLDPSVVFSSPDLAWSTVTGILNTFGETNSYRGRFLLWYGFNTDIEWYNTHGSGTDRREQLAGYSATATNSEMNTDNNAWAMMYQGIERANLAIQGLRTYGNPEPGTELGHILGEVLTLRAVLYADLVKAWGDVPARFEPISTETMYLPKSDRDVIYKQIIADLGEAATLVDWPGTAWTGSVEHVNRTFVKGLRARLCLNAAGFSQRPDGEVRRSTDPDLSVTTLYTIAKQELSDILTNEGISGSLENDFETVFRKVCEDNIVAGGESLWEIPFSPGRGRMAYHFAVRQQGDANQFTTMMQGGSVGPLPTVYFDFDPADTRRDVTCIPYQWNKGKMADGTPAEQELRGFDQWCFGKIRFEWMNRYVTAANDDGVNKQYMRYAEIPLMMAEVLNELEGPAAAKPYLQMIRERAFKSEDWGTKVTDYLAAISTKEQMFNAIVDEYAFEFCGEMLRKEQLIRWNLLKAKMEDAKGKMIELVDRAGKYAYLSGDVYYSLSEPSVAYNNVYSGTYPNTVLRLYGLNPGETGDPGAGYSVESSWFNDLTRDKINSLFFNDPNTKQFWPIWEVFISNSNGQLTNDYGY